MSNDKVIEAVEEASISVACLLDAVHGEELQKDVEHIQDQLSLIENFLGRKAMSGFNFNEKDLKENGWEVFPDGVWFGFDLADSHKANIPTILSELIGFDSDAEGYNFLICAYKKEKSDE
jgi:hypothetical protein